MRPQSVLMGLIILFLCLGLTGCEQFNPMENTETNKFVGIWQNTTGYPARIVFSSDGQCIYGSETGTWKLQDSKLSIELADSGLIYAYNYWFSNNNKTLLLTKTFGYSILYSKQ